MGLKTTTIPSSKTCGDGWWTSGFSCMRDHFLDISMRCLMFTITVAFSIGIANAKVTDPDCTILGIVQHHSCLRISCFV